MRLLHRLTDLSQPLAHRRFRSLWLARTTSLVGDGFNQVALPFAALALDGGSAGDVGLVFAARSVPQVVFGLLAGVAGDRMSRSRLMIVSDVTCASTQVLAGVLLLSGRGSLVALCVLAFLYGSAVAFFRPASTALIPQTVPAEHLQQANALLGMTQNVAGIAAPALGGLLVALSPGVALVADGGTFLLSALFLLGLRDLPGAIETSTGVLQELREGLAYVVQERWLGLLIVAFAVSQVAVLGGLYVLGPTIAEQQYDGAKTWGLLLAAVAAGGISASFMAASWAPTYEVRAQAFCLAVMSLPMFALAAGMTVWVVLVAMFVFGVVATLANVLWQTTLQRHVPAHLLSRVSSIDWTGSTALKPIGQATIGFVAVGIGLAGALTAAAAVLVLGAALPLLTRHGWNLQAGPQVDEREVAEAEGKT